MSPLSRRASRFPGLLLAFTLILCSELPWSRLDAAEGERRPFALAAGPAQETLETFSEQAGAQIVFLLGDVNGATTKPIHGDFVVREALDRMVAGTGLEVMQDERTRAFVIKRGRNAQLDPDASSEPGQVPSSTVPQNKSMKSKSPFAVIGAWLALAVAPLHSHAAEPGVASATISGRVQNVATGQYLNNARITLHGSKQVVFTDETGAYVLPQVPAGTATVDVFYTGLDAQSTTVQVQPGQTVTKNFDLLNAARNGDASVLKLDAYTVSSERETDANAIAVNEQRFAPNVKNVVAADTMGEVMDGNVGEFLKFMPGITADYDNEDGSTIAYISVRGISPAMTSIMTDGASMASTSTTTGDSRQFSFNSTSINNIARVEVTKVPTPANPADSLGGSVNLITKSAFERKSAEFRYNVNLTGNGDNLVFERQAHTNDKDIYKILPAANFDYTLPINNRLGFVLTGLSSRRYTKQYRSTTTYSIGGTSTGASVTNPYLANYIDTNSPRVISRDSFGLKADWRVTRFGVLSATYQWSHYESERYATQFTINAGTVGTPSIAGGIPLTFGPDFVNGATGRGSVTMGDAASVHPDLTTRGGGLHYRYDNGVWRATASFDYSDSGGGYLGIGAGNFRALGITSSVPLRVNFRGADPIRPTVVEIYDNNNLPWDMNDVRNYKLSTARSSPRETEDQFVTDSASLRRSFSLFGLPSGIEIGGSERNQTRDIRRQDISWTYNGINGDFTPAPYLSPVKANQDNFYGFTDYPYVSPILAEHAFSANPNLFSKTLAQQVTEETFRIKNSFNFRENVSAAYIQGDSTFLDNRLHVLTGVRFEHTDVSGVGPLVDPAAVYVRTSDGGFAHDAAGARIRKPEAGAIGSLEELHLTTLERAARNSQTYDGYYPSIHFTYNITNNFLARLAYAKTYGRPNITDIVPTTTINELDEDSPDALQGTISLSNPSLKPWSADNYDFSLEYYTDKGGIFTIGVFEKNIKNFFGTSTFLSTLADTVNLGLGPEYVNYQVTTRINVGNAEIQGGEFSVRQSLDFLGQWGRPFSVFANGTKLKLEGNRLADFTGFVPETLNWGATIHYKRLEVMGKWNYRGKERNGTSVVLGPDGYTYQERRTSLDLEVDLQLYRRFGLFFNAQNIFNAPYITQIYGSQTPDYAKRNFTNHNGVGLTLGVKGSF